MKIALYNLTTTIKIGGVESIVWDIGQRLAERGHTVTLFGGNGAVNRAINSPTFRERFSGIGDEPAGGTPEEFAVLIKRELGKWRDVVKRSGARLD